MDKLAPFIKLELKTGESRSFECNGIQYKVGINRFADHDHKNYPLYYYPVPIEHENPELFVVWFEDNANDTYKYPSPYAGSVEGSFYCCRYNVNILCEKMDQNVFVSVFKAESLAE